MPFTIDVKHDTDHRVWKRLSVVAIAPDRLVADLEAHVVQYAQDHQMNFHQVAGRVVEINSSQIGSTKDLSYKTLIKMRESNATANSGLQSSPKSISDDDLCSGCANCQHKAGELSNCSKNWPGEVDEDGYVQTCVMFSASNSRD